MKKTIILACAIVLLASGCNLTKPKPIVLAPEEARAKTEEFINNNLMQAGKKAAVKEVVEENGLYKMMVDIGTDKDIESYVSLDGTKFFPQAMEMEKVEKAAKEAKSEEPNAGASQARQAPKEYSDEEIEKIKNFVNCLAEKDFKIYGADWCGWTKKLTVDIFGGFDVVEPIYVECTKEKDLCSQEQVQGYPTIKVGGEKYQGERTFMAFAQATKCEAPGVAEQASSSTGGCN